MPHDSMKTTQLTIQAGLLACLLTASLLAIPPSHAANIADPTRPPDAWLATRDGTEATKQEKDSPGGARVAIIGKRQRYAVIDGQVVKAGDAIGDGTVDAIRPDGVVIRQGDDKKMLSMTPGVEKKIRNSGQ